MYSKKNRVLPAGQSRSHSCIAFLHSNIKSRLNARIRGLYKRRRRRRKKKRKKYLEIMID
jgi:hypothetical protein